MKHFFSTLSLLLFSALIWAQAPQAVNYQGVARNAAGTPYASQAISVRLSIRNHTMNGTVVYSETRNVTTNAFGLFNIQVGSAGASAVQGDFAGIDWSNGSKFLQTEISVSSQPYINLGTTQMISVPYSIHSMQARQLVLPYDTIVNSNSGAAFSISNTSVGQYPAINGQSVNGDAVTGTSEKKSGVSGYSQAAGIGGVLGANAAVGGYGVQGYVAANNTTGAGVFGLSLNGAGVRGETSFGTGILGIATGTGAGMRAYANDGIGLSSSATTGTAVFGQALNPGGIAGAFYQTNATGLAMNIIGNVKISGGNTSPGANKVLTSDETGNASWRSLPTATVAPKVAFKLSDAFPGGLNNYSETNWFKVYFDTEEYDYGNTISTGGTTANSVFTAPYTGVYHFDASVGVRSDGIFAWIDIVKQNSAGQITCLKVSVYAETLRDNPDNVGLRQTNSVSTDAKLDAGDKVYVRFRWMNGEVSDPGLTGISAANGASANVNVTQFSGHLVFAQ